MRRGIVNLHNERGGALLIAMIAAVFLTLLGTILLSIVRQGFVQAASSEGSVQAEALAQKGLDEAQALIRMAVEEANHGAPGGFSYQTKIDRIHQSLGKDIDPSPAVTRTPGSLHHFIHNSETTGLKGSYRLEVISDVDNYESFKANRASIADYPYSRVITIRSTGTVGEQPVRSVAKEAEFVISTINPVFKYPLSAKQDIQLNGASAIIGDILARSGSIAAGNKAKFVGLPGSSYAKQSDDPSVRGFYREGAEKAKQFSYWLPFEDPWMPLDEDMDIEQRYVKPRMIELDAVMPAAGSGINTGGLGPYMLPPVSSSLKLENQWLHAAGSHHVSGDLAVKGGAFTMEAAAALTVSNGSIYVDFPTGFSAAADLSGELLLSAGEALVVRGDAVINDGFNFSGNLVVEGNLKIVGSVNMGGTVYVKGDVELKQTRTINQDAAWINHPLIVLADGSIQFSDSRPGGEPSELRAFFYSTEDIHLYGVQSRLYIQGGIHGWNVVLNAVREGDAATKTDTSYEGVPLSGEQVFTFTPVSIQETLSPEHSNLRIAYDDELYRNPPAGIPTTDDVTLFVQK